MKICEEKKDNFPSCHELPTKKKILSRLPCCIEAQIPEKDLSGGTIRRRAENIALSCSIFTRPLSCVTSKMLLCN